MIDLHEPPITVIIPLFNKVATIGRAISSVLSQTYGSFELIVVDDGSTDLSASVVKSFSDSRLRLISQANMGVSAARNCGIASAKHELLAFLDADDYWDSRFLEVIVHLCRDFPMASWYATACAIVLPGVPGDALTKSTPRISTTRGIVKNFFVAATNADALVTSSSVAIQRSAIQSIGCFPVGIASGEDMLTWSKIAVQYDLAVDPQRLAVWDVSGINRRPDRERLVEKQLIGIYRQSRRLPGLRQYIGKWIRIQAELSLIDNDNLLGRRAALRSIYYSPKSFKSWYIASIFMLPFPDKLRVHKSIKVLMKYFMSRRDGQS